MAGVAPGLYEHLVTEDLTRCRADIDPTLLSVRDLDPAEDLPPSG
jgi:hypothetical protein